MDPPYCLKKDFPLENDAPREMRFSLRYWIVLFSFSLIKNKKQEIIDRILPKDFIKNENPRPIPSPLKTI